MTYPEAIERAEKIDSYLRYIVKPNTTTASAMILQEMNAISMFHLLKEGGEKALDNFIERLEEKNEEIRSRYLAWFFKKTDQDNIIRIRVSESEVVVVKLWHEIEYGISWASIGKAVVAFHHYTGTKAQGTHRENLRREASYQLGMKVYHYLET